MLRFSEKVLITLAFIGFILKAFYFEHAGGTLTFLALAALSAIYAVLGWRIFRLDLNRNEKQPQFIFSIFVSLALSFGLWAFMYKYFSWQNSGWLLCGYLSLGIILFLLFRIQALDYGAHRYVAMRLTILSVACVIILLIPNHSIIKFFYRFDPKLADLHIQVYEHPGNKQHHMEYQQYLHDLYQGEIRDNRNK